MKRPLSAKSSAARLHLTTPERKSNRRKNRLCHQCLFAPDPPAASKQVPAFTHMVVTEPLTPAQLETIGWKNRQGIEDARNLVHYFRLTIDNRWRWAAAMSAWHMGETWSTTRTTRLRDLRTRRGLAVPQPERHRFTHRWGGPVSVPVRYGPRYGSSWVTRAPSTAWAAWGTASR